MQQPMPPLPGMAPGMPGMPGFPLPPANGLPAMPPGMPGVPGMPPMQALPPGVTPEMMQQMINTMQAQIAAGGAMTGPGGSGPGAPGAQMAGGLPPLPGLAGMTLPSMQPPPGMPPGMPPLPPPLGAPPGQGLDGSNPTLAALLGAAEVGMPQMPPPMQPPPGPPPTPGIDAKEAERSRREENARREAASRNRAAQEQVEAKARMAEVEKMKCHLHKKPKDSCKFCKKHKELLDAAQKQNPSGKKTDSRGGPRRRPDRAISEDRGDDRGGPLEIANPKNFGFSGLLQTHIVECAHFKSLMTLENFEQVVDETTQFANSAEPYMTNSVTVPSALFCCLYRFFTMNLDARSLRRLIDSVESPFVRCAGLLYVRMGLPHDQILGWLGEYLVDDEEFKPSPDSEIRTTIGDFVETLLSQDRYYNTVLPRLPMVTKRHVEEMLAPLGQNRKRMAANKSSLDVFRDTGTKIECNIGGEWLAGSLMELDEDPPNRPKVRARMVDGSEEYVHLGKVIIADPKVRTVRNRDRSRSRTDWCREKGRSDRELLDEMRSREREKAVCSSGKDYARKPLGYKAACALPREQGQASYRLMEEETFVPMNRGPKSRRSPSPDQQNFGRGRQSAEHQARMQQLFEKYGNAARPEASGSGGRHDDILDRADVMRLG